MREGGTGNIAATVERRRPPIFFSDVETPRLSEGDRPKRTEQGGGGVGGYAALSPLFVGLPTNQCASGAGCGAICEIIGTLGNRI